MRRKNHDHWKPRKPRTRTFSDFESEAVDRPQTSEALVEEIDTELAQGFLHEPDDGEVLPDDMNLSIYDYVRY